jgi:hypothetical protein
VFTCRERERERDDDEEVTKKISKMLKFLSLVLLFGAAMANHRQERGIIDDIFGSLTQVKQYSAAKRLL